MRHGDRKRVRQRGIAYLGALLLISGVCLSLMQATQVWQTVQRREKEAQLLFVGDQFRQAIARYYNSASGSSYPPTLDVLLDDRRTPNPLRHLRRMYADPLSGSTQWGIVKSPEGGVMGVYSQAPGQPLKQRGFHAPNENFEDKHTYREWAFTYVPATAAREGGQVSIATP